MTGSIMPAPRRRFLAMLWLSLALHALVIGLTQLPPPVQVALSPQFDVEIERSVPMAPAVKSAPEPAPTARPVIKPAPASPVQQRLIPMPVSPPPAVPPANVASAAPGAVPPPQAEPATAAGREAPGPVINVPVLMDARYYPARELDMQPAALRKPEPVYPVRAEEHRVAGRVLVRLYLEADGSISRTEVISVAPGGAYGEMFKKATLDSLKDLRFRPARRNGQPVRALVEIPVVFDPDE